jgi:hypothetical protein
MRAESCGEFTFPTHMVCLDESVSETFQPSGVVLNKFCAVTEDYVGFSGLNYSVVFPFCLSDYDPSLFGIFNNVDAYLGIGYTTRRICFIKTLCQDLEHKELVLI